MVPREQAIISRSQLKVWCELLHATVNEYDIDDPNVSWALVIRYPQQGHLEQDADPTLISFINAKNPEHIQMAVAIDVHSDHQAILRQMSEKQRIATLLEIKKFISLHAGVEILMYEERDDTIHATGVASCPTNILLRVTIIESLTLSEFKNHLLLLQELFWIIVETLHTMDVTSREA